METVKESEVYKMASDIINRVAGYNKFKDSEQIKRDSAKRLARYIIENDNMVAKGEHKKAEWLINEWIRHDLMKLKSQALQNNTSETYVPTKKKQVSLGTKVVVGVLTGFLICSIASTGLFSKPKEPEPTLPPYYDPVDDKLAEMKRREDAKRERELAERIQQNLEFEAKLEEAAKQDKYHKPLEYNDYAKQYTYLLEMNYDINFREYGSEFAALPLYDICCSLFTEYEKDSFRTMDMVFRSLQSNLKHATLPNIDKSEYADSEYQVIAGYRTYLEYVYNVLKEQGYDVAEYASIVQKYSTYEEESKYPLENNGLSDGEVLKMNDMFAMYGEYMHSLEGRKGVRK